MHQLNQLKVASALFQVGTAGFAACGSVIVNAWTHAPCRSQQDELVFALHAAVLASGYRLVAVGDQADLESA